VRHPDLLVGTDTFDDAGVFRLDAETALVQTADFFPPLVNDAYEFGRIAAANALSDVYAMGGTPLTALNLVGFPEKDADPQWLLDMMRGGAERVQAAGAVLVGGHSVRDAEIKYGLSVTGRVHPDRVWTNAGAKPGDRLVLSKPIGSGVLTSAAKAGKIPESELEEAIHVMTKLNADARDAASGVTLHACTDVTGFGLIGHAFEMAAGSGNEVALSASKIPLLKQTLELARAGQLTRAWQSTRNYLADRFQVGPDVDDTHANVLLDAQTSGGLLMSVPESEVGRLTDALEQAGAICNAVVGEIRAADKPLVRLEA